MDRQLLHAVQEHASPAADLFWSVVTRLGSEEMLGLLWILVWVSGPRNWWWVTAMFLAGLVANDLAKEVFDRPRPGPPEFRMLDPGDDPGYAFPSGHAQGSAFLYGFLALRVKQGWQRAVLLCLPLLVGLSRLYLGRHWPSDVLGGLLVGGLWVGMARSAERLEVPRRLERPLGAGAMAIGASAIAALHGTLDAVRPLSMLAAGSLGYAIERTWLPTPPAEQSRRPWRASLLRVAIGIAGALALQFGLAPANPQDLPLQAVRYASLGLWLTLLGPALFRVVPGTGTASFRS